MAIDLGLFLVVTGIAFLVGTALRLAYVAYLRSRSARDVRRVMKQMRFTDLGETSSSSSSDASDESDEEMGGGESERDSSSGRRRRKGSGWTSAEAASSTVKTWSERELALPPLRDKVNGGGALPPLGAKNTEASTAASKTPVSPSGKENGRGGDDHDVV